ncbi:hypothetical protein D9M68_859820 [compost metagenome]
MHHGLNLLIAKWKAFLLFALPQCLLDLLVGQGEVLTMSRRFASKAQQIDFELPERFCCEQWIFTRTGRQAHNSQLLRNGRFNFGE